jgi:hypothetical protein
LDRPRRLGRLAGMPSTAIRGISYDDDSATLFVTFVDGDLYAYQDVPRQTYEAFVRAPSKGRYFAAHVRGLHPYRKMPQAAPRPNAIGPGGPAWRRPAGAGR